MLEDPRPYTRMDGRGRGREREKKGRGTESHDEENEVERGGILCDAGMRLE